MIYATTRSGRKFSYATFPRSFSDDFKAYVMERSWDLESHSGGEPSANVEPQFGFNVNEKHTHCV